MKRDNPVSTTHSRRKPILGGVAVILVAAIVTVAFVLPAEFGIDPTGIGRMTGLIRLNTPASTSELERGAKRTGVLTVSNTAPAVEEGNQDRWTIELGPYESVEFKYTIEESRSMGFTWQSSEPLYYDMHAHPFDGGEDLTESYGVGQAAGMHGRYVAPFTGIHGWYWQNRNLEPVTLTLEATGDFSASTIFDATGKRNRPIVDAPADTN